MELSQESLNNLNKVKEEISKEEGDINLYYSTQGEAISDYFNFDTEVDEVEQKPEKENQLEKAVITSEIAPIQEPNISNEQTSEKDKYKKFIKETKKVSNENVLNIIKYGGSDLYHKLCENFEKINKKKDVASQRIEDVEILIGNGRKNVKELDDLIKEYEIGISNSQFKLMGGADKLKNLKEKYSTQKRIHKISKSNYLSKADEIKNVFYSIFNRKKIKQNNENLEQMKNRVALENEVNSLNNEIKYQSKILKNDKKFFRKNKNQLKDTKNDKRKINYFLENSRDIQDFYEEYLENSSKTLPVILDL
jgi:hypothetical protein